jgi:hypothetical protein
MRKRDKDPAQGLKVVKIIRAPAPKEGPYKPEYYCNRCGCALENPVEKTSVYVLPKSMDPELICLRCVRETDQYLWGNPVILAD